MEIKGWDEQLWDIVELAKQFSQESALPVTYDYNSTKTYLWRIINDPDSTIFAEYIDDKIAGGIIVSRASEFCAEYLGYIIKLYVTPEGRGTAVARNLMKQATEWFDEKDCVKVFASATAAIGQDKAFINLLAKYGFTPNGQILIR